MERSTKCDIFKKNTQLVSCDHINRGRWQLSLTLDCSHRASAIWPNVHTEWHMNLKIFVGNDLPEKTAFKSRFMSWPQNFSKKTNM